jgi:energy-coupling factor transporter ATP-binding protein EcfA2
MFLKGDKKAMAATRFGRLAVRGYRRSASVEFDLRPLTVVIGANGSGKTSLLEALSLLARSAQGRRSFAAAWRHPLFTTRWMSRPGHRFGFRSRCAPPNCPELTARTGFCARRYNGTA